MFAKPNTTIGIDLGTHSVKAVQLSKVGDGARVEKATLINLSPDLSEEKRTEDVIRALRTISSTFNAKNAILVTALPGEDTFIRYLRFPKMPPEELRSSIELEADQNLPYDLMELSIDSVVLEEMTERDETIMKVLLVAAKNEVVDQTLELYRTVGLMPHMLGVTTLAIADAFEANAGFRADETIALINVGASSTNIHFCRDGISNFTRDISRAGRDLTASIQKLMKVSFDEAEQMKINYGSGQPGDAVADIVESLEKETMGKESEDIAGGDMPETDGEADVTTEPMRPSGSDDTSRLVNATRPALSRLIGEIRRSIDYYEKQLYEKSVDRLILSGGTAVFPGLDQSLADATGVPVEIVNPVHSFIMEDSSPDVQSLLKNRAQFNVAVGLAARGIEAL
jgi:type IV pilus assembly protein PilM